MCQKTRPEKLEKEIKRFEALWCGGEPLARPMLANFPEFLHSLAVIYLAQHNDSPERVAGTPDQRTWTADDDLGLIEYVAACPANELPDRLAMQVLIKKCLKLKGMKQNEI